MDAIAPQKLVKLTDIQNKVNVDHQVNRRTPRGRAMWHRNCKAQTPGQAKRQGGGSVPEAAAPYRGLRLAIDCVALTSLDTRF